MKKKLIILIGFIILLGIGVGVFLYVNHSEEMSDSLKFKEEYESLNGTIRESDGATYNSVSIPTDNPIKYVTVDEAIDIVNNGTGILYIGANWCPWCRNAVEVLIDVAMDNNIDVIYYLDITSIRNIWEVIDGEAVKTTEEQEGYYELLEALDSILDEYILTDSDGNTYDTQEKRIYMPNVIGIKNGVITSNHVSTVTLNSDQTKYDKLTDEQYEELYNIYEELINTVYTTECSDEYC